MSVDLSEIVKYICLRSSFYKNVLKNFRSIIKKKKTNVKNLFKNRSRQEIFFA